MEAWDFQSKKLESFAGLLFLPSGIKTGPKQIELVTQLRPYLMKTLLTLCLTLTALTSFAQTRPAAPPPPPPPPNTIPGQNPPPPPTNPAGATNPAVAQPPAGAPGAPGAPGIPAAPGAPSDPGGPAAR